MKISSMLTTIAGTHQKMISVDEIAFYYANHVRVLPNLYVRYIDGLSDLEHQRKVCLLPDTVLERYHLELSRRITNRIRRLAKIIA